MIERVDFLPGGNLISLNLKKRKAVAREVSKKYCNSISTHSSWLQSACAEF